MWRPIPALYDPVAFYPFAQAVFDSVPPGGYQLLAGQTAPKPQRLTLTFLKEFDAAPVVKTVLVNGPGALSFEDSSGSDTRKPGVLPIKAAISLVTESHWQVSEFLPNTDRQIQFRVDSDSLGPAGTSVGPLYRGWLVAAGGNEDYADKPYKVTFRAGDGLKSLKDRVPLTIDEKYATDAQTFLQVLEGILVQTGYNLPLTSLINLTQIQDRLAETIGSPDPLVRLKYRAEAFRTAPDSTNPLSAYEALEHLCKVMTANLMQINGRWYFYRTAELGGGWLPSTVNGSNLSRMAYFRHYGLPGTGTNATPEVRNSTVPVGPGYPLRIEGGGETEPDFARPAVRVEQKYSPAKSLLVNGDFAAISNVGVPTGWFKQNPGHPFFSRLGTGTPADPFRVHITGAGDNLVPIDERNLVTLNQIVAHPTNTHVVEAMVLKGRFRGKNVRGAKIVVRAQLSGQPVSGAPDWFLLQSDGTWKGAPSRAERVGIQIDNVAKAGNSVIPKEDWADIDIRFNKLTVGLASIVNYEIKVGQAIALDGAQAAERWIEYADMTLQYETENQYTGRQYTVRHWNTTPAEVLAPSVESEYTIYYGDATFAPIGETSRQLLTTATNGDLIAAYGFDKPTTANASGNGAPLALWAARELAAQCSITARRLGATLHGDLPYGPLTLLQLMDEPGQPRMLPVGWTWTPGLHTWDVSALEYLTTPHGTMTGAYLTDTGEIPFTPESVGGLDTSDREVPAVKKKTTEVLTTGKLADYEAKGYGKQYDITLPDVLVMDPAERKVQPALDIYNSSGTKLSTVAAILRKLTH